MTAEKGDSVMWGGRFVEPPDPDMIAFTQTLVDLRLLSQDLASTVAHAAVLEAAELLTTDEVAAIAEACNTIDEEGIPADPVDEDVHSYVERRLTEILGETGQKIHAGRSRNDLVASDFRQWCTEAADDLAVLVGVTIETICSLAEVHVDSVMPGYTHLQRGQPVTLAFHLLAHGFALARDAERFLWVEGSSDVSVLGAGALAGTTLPLDARIAADQLGTDVLFDNAMDAVSDRDFAAELTFAVALCSVHLSRLAEELVMWTGAEFGFARISDEWSTGSSMMPQKRNPDVAELIRGKSAPAIGDLTSLLVLLKGLPLAYNRDLQEDKEIVLRAATRVASCLMAMPRLLESLKFDTERMAAAAGEAGTWATDVAETLVLRGVPFREAHGIAGSLVAKLESKGIGLAEAGDLLTDHDPRLKAEDAELADPTRSVAARRSHGGPAPERVREQLAKLRSIAERLKQDD